MASSASVDFDTGHTGPIHDVQFDALGRCIATASGDGTIRIFTVPTSSSDEEPKLLQTLTGHTGPVWQVSWAPNSFGSFLASASFDNTLRIWQIGETSYTVNAHTASVNSCAWSPASIGMVLASGSLDGTVAITRWDPSINSWAHISADHGAGVLAVAWRPTEDDVADKEDTSVALASGGTDGRVVIWRFAFKDTNITLTKAASVSLRAGWVRAIAFPKCPWGGSLAAGTADGLLAIIDRGDDGEWDVLARVTLSGPIQRVAFDALGGTVAAAIGDGTVQNVSLRGGNVWALDE